MPQDCTGYSVCGNGIREGTEPCDDGNGNWRDGCTPDCKGEPNCSGGACISKCGDGMLLPGDATEACDDGNTASGDGCSATCTIEPGYTCTVAAHRDAAADGHPRLHRLVPDHYNRTSATPPATTT